MGERAREIEDDLTPFGFIEDGMDESEKLVVEDGEVWQVFPSNRIYPFKIQGGSLRAYDTKYEITLL